MAFYFTMSFATADESHSTPLRAGSKPPASGAKALQSIDWSFTGDESPAYHPTDEDLSVGTPAYHPTDEDLSVGTPAYDPGSAQAGPMSKALVSTSAAGQRNPLRSGLLQCGYLHGFAAVQ